MSVRAKLALSYAAVVVISGGLLLGVVWVFLLRYVPEYIDTTLGFVPNKGDLQRAFVPKALLAMGCLIVTGLAGGWLLAGRMLAPLEHIGEAARLAARGSLSHRIRLRGSGDEFHELADVFDDMLARLEAHVSEQERFAANASHELRTPLAVTRTLLEVAERDPDRDVDELISRLSAVNNRAIELADALLMLSKTTQQRVEPVSVDLSLVAEEAAENLLPLAEQRGVRLDVMGNPVTALGSEVLLGQLVSNLVHNAIVHNVPERGGVSVHTGLTREAAVLTIENTGPVIDPELLPQLTEPFARGAKRTRTVSRDHAGAGLGLAIVNNIVHAHGGSIAFAARPGGGLTVVVTLPAVPSAP